MKLTMMLLCAGALMAQCPVEISKIYKELLWGRREIDLEDPAGAPVVPTALTMTVKNVSGKEIQAVRMRAWMADAVEEFRAIPANMDTGRIKVGKAAKVGYKPPYYQSGDTGWLVVPIKVLFSDGTKWENEEGACFGQRWWKKEHPPLKELPAVVKGKGAD